MNEPQIDVSDTVARRIVMPREVWEQLLHLTTALRETRNLEASPDEVALIALEAGLAEIRRGSPANRAQSASKTASGRTRRLARPLRLTDEEKAEVDALAAAQGTVRGRQRALALWLGLRRRRVEVEALRELAVRFDAYDVANFAQNMKKDGALFRELKSNLGERTGWRLTRIGQERAEALLESALATA